MVVNDKKMLKDVVVLSNTPGKEDHRYQWPEIDFEKYSLVIGHFFTSNIGYCVAKQYIVKKENCLKDIEKWLKLQIFIKEGKNPTDLKTALIKYKGKLIFNSME